MNIFILDENIQKCAQYHADKHVIKMILESAQLLCSAHWMTGNEAPYRLTHKNHPCSKWVRKSIKNYRWLVKLGLALCTEYTYRYSKTHKTEEKLDWLHDNEPDLPDKEMTNFVLVMPDKYKCKDPVQAYRAYYRGEKENIATWKDRPIPDWFEVE